MKSINKTHVVFWGASGHAKSVANALIARSDIEVAGYLDDVSPERHGKIFNGKEILGGSEQLAVLKEKGITSIILGFGHCLKRIQIGQMLIEAGFTLPAVIHPQAIIAPDATIEKGVVILAGSVIDSGCSIDNYCIINNGAIVCHDCRIGPGAHVCPGVRLAGKVSIGRGCWIGIGATIIDKIKVGDHAFIGAGSVVTKDIPSGSLACGNPARVIRNIDKDF